jgi:hypothetical protein
MFSLLVIDTDVFLDLPLTSQAFYFHLSMRADDDGFIDNVKKIKRMIGASDGDYEVLIEKGFLLKFETGVCVIRHWRIHNYIAKDRRTLTIYSVEKDLIHEDDNKIYQKGSVKCIQDVNSSYTECIQDADEQHTPCIQNVDLVKSRVVKSRLVKKSQSKREENIGFHSDSVLNNNSLMQTVGSFKNLTIKTTELEDLIKTYSEAITYKFIDQISNKKENQNFKVSSVYKLAIKFIENAIRDGELIFPDGLASKYSKVIKQQAPQICEKCGKKLDNYHRCTNCNCISEYDPKSNTWNWEQLADQKTLQAAGFWKGKLNGEVN